MKISDGETVTDQVVAAIGMVGENMAIPRATFFRADDRQTIGCFVHSAGALVTTSTNRSISFHVLSLRAGASVSNVNCNLGKYGAAVVIRPFDMSVQLPKIEMQQVARNLAQHVVGLKPTEIGSSLDKRKTPKDEEETRLLFQEYLLDSDLTVSEYCSQMNVIVDDFIRFECGELSEFE